MAFSILSYISYLYIDYLSNNILMCIDLYVPLIFSDNSILLTILDKAYFYKNNLIFSASFSSVVNNGIFIYVLISFLAYTIISLILGTPYVTSALAKPAKWNVFNVI